MWAPEITCRIAASCRNYRRIHMSNLHEAEIRHVKLLCCWLCAGVASEWEIARTVIPGQNAGRNPDVDDFVQFGPPASGRPGGITVASRCHHGGRSPKMSVVVGRLDSMKRDVPSVLVRL